MNYSLYSARTVTIIHAGYIISITAGSIAVYLWSDYFVYHLFLLSLTVLGELPFRGACPMTMLENYFRARSTTLHTYSESFLEHYLSPRISTSHQVRLVHYRWAFVLLCILSVASLLVA